MMDAGLVWFGLVDNGVLVLAVVAGCIVGPVLAGVVVGAWRLVSNGLGLAGDGRRRVDTAREASEG